MSETTINACLARKILTAGAIFPVFVAALTLFGLLSPAQAAKPTTYIVLDAATGQVLNEHGADELNYPASLTKMMTLFLTFEALERHQISLNTEFTISRHAAAQQPSKLGLVPGSTISVHDLILSIVTHSANDSAVVLAEGLAGSEDAFAVRMNREARLLGMTRTNFRNASGLPNRFQYTTARDLSKLALALYRTFPREYGYFATESFTYRGETYGNHNHLMEAFQGMDGIKTGFINASGFNLAASAVRNNRRLVGVIMGGRSASSRDMEMAELLDDGFAHRGPASTMVASTEAPAHRALPLRNADGLSPVSKIAVATPAPKPVAAVAAVPAAAPAPAPHDAIAELANSDDDADEAAPPPRHHHLARHHVAHHSVHHHVRTASRHHGRRHGIVLASYERDEEAAPARHHYRHSAKRHRHHVTRRHIVAERRHHIVASGHHRISQHRFARLHQEHSAKVRHFVVKATPERAHGVACGGWAGHNQPCPPSLRSTRRAALRSAELRHAPIHSRGVLKVSTEG